MYKINCDKAGGLLQTVHNRNSSYQVRTGVKFHVLSRKRKLAKIFLLLEFYNSFCLNSQLPEIWRMGKLWAVMSFKLSPEGKGGAILYLLIFIVRLCCKQNISRTNKWILIKLLECNQHLPINFWNQVGSKRPLKLIHLCLTHKSLYLSTFDRHKAKLWFFSSWQSSSTYTPSTKKSGVENGRW